MVSWVCLWFTLCLFCSGVLSGLLDQELTFRPSDQLRVMICGDAILQPNRGQQYLQVLSATTLWPLFLFPFLKTSLCTPAEFLGSYWWDAAEVWLLQCPSGHCPGDAPRWQGQLQWRLEEAAIPRSERGWGILSGWGPARPHHVCASTSLPAQWRCWQPGGVIRLLHSTEFFGLICKKSATVIQQMPFRNYIDRFLK